VIRSIDIAARGNRWSRRHPLEKMVFYLGGLALIMAAPGDRLLAAALAVASLAIAGTLLLARVPLRLYLGLVAVPTAFLLTSVAALAVSLDWSDGWHLALASHAWQTIWPVFVRTVATLTCLVGLATTTPVSDMLAFAGRAGVPAFLTDLALMMYRQIWITLEIVERSIAAQRARLGFVGYRGTLRSLGIVAATLFPRLLARSQRIELGLAARNFEGRLAFRPAGEALSVTRLAATLALLVLAGVIAALFPVAP
jgi:cobalt/nickel transport system permease protein